MAEGPLAKKIRIWNPAVSEHNESSEEPEVQDEKPLDCTSKVSQIQFPEIFQNYLHLAPLMMRMQQQRQIEEFARRQFFSQLAQPSRILPIPPPMQAQVPSVSEPVVVPPITTVPPITMSNPIVATALGSPLINENCCAVCGAAFRLTGDLVQHMRNNHRKSKFKRKSDLRQ